MVVVGVEPIAEGLAERATHVRPELVRPEASAHRVSAVERRGSGQLGHDADGAPRRAAAVEGGARPLEDVHPLHVGQRPEIAVDLGGVEDPVAVELRGEPADDVALY